MLEILKERPSALVVLLGLAALYTWRIYEHWCDKALKSPYEAPGFRENRFVGMVLTWWRVVKVTFVIAAAIVVTGLITAAAGQYAPARVALEVSFVLNAVAMFTALGRYFASLHLADMFSRRRHHVTDVDPGKK